MQTKRKSDLPSKICRICGRPFSWRKKWEKQWDQIQICSERCRRNRNQRNNGTQTHIG
ncbi:MAG: DUF2256 domain-containing protein [Saprospiraceae bacterium]|nr:DUF2256 domain-containing protein [Saprospiraceae bacterium]